MNYAILAHNTITAHGTASVLWPKICFASSGPNASFLIEAGAVAIRSDATHNPETEVLQSCPPYQMNGEVFNSIAAPKPPEPVMPQWTALLGDLQTFAAAWAAARTAGLVDTDLVKHMQEVATTYDLPEEFIAGLAA